MPRRWVRRVGSCVFAATIGAIASIADAPGARAEVEEVDCNSLEHVKVGGTASLIRCESGTQRGRDSEGSGRPTSSAWEIATGFDLAPGAMFVLVRAESSHYSAFGATTLREFADGLFGDVRDWQDTGRTGSFETASLEGQLNGKSEYSSCSVFLDQFKATTHIDGYKGFFGGYICGLGGDLDPAKASAFLETVSY